MVRLFVVLVLLGISSMGKAQGSISNDTLVTEQSLRDSIADFSGKWNMWIRLS